MHFRAFAACLITVAALFVSAARAAEVTLPYKKLTLNANLELAEGKKLSDGVILITHGALAHRGMEAIVYLQGLLKEHGYNTLAINLSLGLDKRHGMYDCKVTHRHTNDDAAAEIDAWVNWLKGKGAKRVVLLGHSRGGAQTALHAATRNPAPVKAVVLMAPAIADNTDAAAYQRRYGKPLAPVVSKAEQLVKAGKGDTVMEHIGLMNCRDTSATATSFASYYGAKARTDTPSLIHRIKKPALVIVGGGDEVVVGLDKKVGKFVDGKRVQMKVIEGADHFFRDLYSDDAVEALDDFLKGIGEKGAGK